MLVETLQMQVTSLTTQIEALQTQIEQLENAVPIPGIIRKKVIVNPTK